MTTAGLLSVGGRYAEGKLCDLAVDLQRPTVTRLFIGQLPEAVVKTIPYLFTLCAHAQRVAAQAALAAAEGQAPRAADSSELWVEVLHENLWRLLLDWPPALGLAAENAAFIAWRNGRQGPACLATTRSLLADTLQPLARKCLKILVDRGDDSPAQPAARFAPEPWLAYWQGMSAEMPRPDRPTSIGAVYRRRLAEIDAAVAALADGRPFPVAVAGDDGWGIGQTLTARGILTHAVHVVDGKVASFRVQAPTDSYFADSGPLAALLENCQFTSADQARQVLNQAILALDPCLPYVVELQDA